MYSYVVIVDIRFSKFTSQGGQTARHYRKAEIRDSPVSSRGLLDRMDDFDLLLNR